jgi:catechol 2,3-dioxygenase-like lactoylglutathione lyase family enzyme
MSHLALVALVVRDYDAALDFFVNVLQFEVVEDVPSLTNDGRPKRWIVVRPAGGVTGILLARADGDRQAAIVGKQVAGRVGFSCESMISSLRIGGWWRRVWPLFPRRVWSRMARSLSFWISKATGRIC